MKRAQWLQSALATSAAMTVGIGMTACDPPNNFLGTWVVKPGPIPFGEVNRIVIDSRAVTTYDDRLASSGIFSYDVVSGDELLVKATFGLCIKFDLVAAGVAKLSNGTSLYVRTRA